METIGFVGLGIMGAPMAGHLLDAGYSVFASDHRGPPPKSLLDRGLRSMSGLDAVARAATIIITMVPDTPQGASPRACLRASWWST
jgi:2-hydroxy-3-oxopropionate reductase